MVAILHRALRFEPRELPTVGLAQRSARARKCQSVRDYMLGLIDRGQLFVGAEGDEFMLAAAIKAVGNAPFMFSLGLPRNEGQCREMPASSRRDFRPSRPQRGRSRSDPARQRRAVLRRADRSRRPRGGGVNPRAPGPCGSGSRRKAPKRIRGFRRYSVIPRRIKSARYGARGRVPRDEPEAFGPLRSGIRSPA